MKMGNSSAGEILEVVVRGFKKLFPDLKTNKPALRVLVKVKEALEDQDYDCFDDDYEADPELWDKALRASGKSAEAEELKEWLNEMSDD